MDKKVALLQRKEEKKAKHRHSEVLHNHKSNIKLGRHGKSRGGYIYQEGRGFK